MSQNDDILAAILQKLSDMETQNAVHIEQHRSMEKRCASHSEKMDRQGETLYGNGKRGLVTTVAIHGWAIGLIGFVSGASVTAIAVKIFS